MHVALTRRRFAAVLLACALIVAVLPGTAVAERTLGLSTGSFEFSVAAGGEGSGDLVVMNDGDETLDVLVYSANQVVDATGTVTYEVPNRTAGDFSTNPASWISVQIPSSTQTIGNTPMITLEPGERAPVEFSFTVPQNAAPGDHQLLLFFEMLAPSETPEGATAKIAGRLGARIKIRVQGDLVERVEVDTFDARGLVLGDKMPWVFLMRNTGNIDKTVEGTLVLMNGDEEVWSSSVASETVIYAGTNLERSGVAEDLPALGRFVAKLTVTYPLEGAQITERVIEERSVWIVPLWLAVVAIAAIAVLLMYGSWRRAVRAAERKARLARRRAAAEERAGRTDTEEAAIPPEWIESLPHHEPVELDDVGEPSGEATEPPGDVVHE